MSKVTGSLGLPSNKIVSVTTDRTGRTKVTSIFSGLSRKASPKAKNFPEAPKVDPKTMLKAARLKDPSRPNGNGAPGTGPKGVVGGSSGPSQTVTVAPKSVASTNGNETGASGNVVASPRPRAPDRLPPLDPDTAKLVDDLPARLLTISARAEETISGLAVTTREKGRAHVGTDRISLLETRQQLLKSLESDLASLEHGGRYRLNSDPVQGLRVQIIAMIVDLQFPEMAKIRLDYEGLTDQQKGLLSDEDAGNIATLRRAHEDLTKLVMDLRAGVADKPDQARVVTGAFLKAIADAPVLREGAASPHDRLAMAAQLARALSLGDLSVGGRMLANTDDASVRSLLSGFRSQRYGDDAGRLFVARMDVDVVRGIEHDSGRTLGSLSAAELRKLLPQASHTNFDKAVAKGRQAAKLRDEFENQLSRTSRDLGPEKGHLAQCSVLLKLNGARVLNDNGLDIQASGSQIAEALKGLARDNREGAFQIARLADSMQKLADAENEALGYNRFGMMPGASLDTEAILAITGFTEKDVRTLGYDADQVLDGFKDNMVRLGTAGFSGTDHVGSVMNRMRGGAAVLENRDIQDGLKADLQNQTAALGKLVQKEIMADVLGSMDPGELSNDTATALSQAFSGVATGVEEALFRTPDDGLSETGDRLERLGGECSTVRQRMQDSADDMTMVESQFRAARLLLEDHAKGSGGRINLDKPAGLDSAKLILRAIELDDGLKGLTGERRDAQLRERDGVLEKLKGFDASVLNRAGRWSRDAAVPSMAEIRGLQMEASAIIFLRETGPQRLEELRTVQSQLDVSREGLLADRRELAPNLFAAADRLIRAAILATIDFDGKPGDVETAFNPTYDVAGKRERIEALLAEWGLDPLHFGPEIDKALSAPVDGRTLRRFLDETRGASMGELIGQETDRKPSRSTLERVGSFGMSALMLIANKRRVDGEMRRELDVLVGRLPNNSKFDLVSGTEISLNSGRIPVEPSGTVTVRGRLSGSIFKSFVIETGGNGEIKLTGMLGGTVKAGFDVMAGYDPLKNEIAEALKKAGNDKLKVDFRLAAELSLDAGYEGAGGFQVTFPKGEEGRRQAIDAILKLTERQRPSAEIFETVTEVADFSRHKGNAGVKSELSAKIGLAWQPGGDDGDMFGGPQDKNAKSGASNKHGFGASAGISASGGIAGKKEIFTSLDKAVVKTEFQTQIGVSAKVGLYAQTFTALGIATGQMIGQSGLQDRADADLRKVETDSSTGVQKSTGLWDGGNATMPLELAGISYETSVTSIHKKKLEFDRLGTEGREVMTKAELKEITDGGNTKTMHDIVATFTDAMLEKLAKDPVKARQLGSMFDELARNGLSSSQVEVTYNIRSDRLALANELLREADSAKANGDKALARERMAEAQRVIDDRTNYTPARISLIDKTGIKGVANRGMAPLVKLDIVSNLGTERVMMAVDL